MKTTMLVILGTAMIGCGGGAGQLPEDDAGSSVWQSIEQDAGEDACSFQSPTSTAIPHECQRQRARR